MGSLATLVTPVHKRDLERFIFQRESIERCSIEIPQIVIADTEDVQKFRDVPYQNNLTVLSTRDVVAHAIEERRRLGLYRRRNPKRWWLRRHGPWIHGWALQQVIKLSAPKVVQTPVIVCLDADTFFVRHVADSDFVAADGRPYLYETTDGLDAEMGEWPAHSMRFLGLHPVGLKLARYTFSPVVFRRDILLDMQRFISAHHGQPWEEAFLASERMMEYTTYGVYAREIDHLSRVVPTAPFLSAHFWWPEEVVGIERELEQRILATGAKIVGIQSNSGCAMDRYRENVKRIWLNSSAKPDASAAPANI